MNINIILKAIWYLNRTIMLIIFGTTIKFKKDKTDSRQEKYCPFCSKRLMIIKEKQYFSVFFIPLFPINTFSEKYICPQCNYQINS